MIFEISTFKLAKISSKILDTKKNFFFVELCNDRYNNNRHISIEIINFEKTETT